MRVAFSKECVSVSCALPSVVVLPLMCVREVQVKASSAPPALFLGGGGFVLYFLLNSGQCIPI